MPSEKRERQRQNRALKEAEEAKAAKKQQRIAIVKRYGSYTLLFVAALVALKIFFG